MPTPQAPSIQLRFIAASLIILPLFLGLIAWGLDRAFYNLQVEAQRDNLRLQQLLLARAAEWDGAWRVEALGEARLELLGSGLYAFILSPQGEALWQSPSAQQIEDLENPVDAVETLWRTLALGQVPIGGQRFSRCKLDKNHYCYATTLAWGSEGPTATFLLVESRDRLQAARSDYRGYIAALSLAATALLLLAQSLLMRWGLAPLRRIAGAIDRLEKGEQQRLQGPFPGELTPVTRNINQLLDSEQRRRERMRNTVDRLTHVLKSPLMVMRNSRRDDADFYDVVQSQVSRMLGVIEGELARARLDGRSADLLGRAVPVAPVLRRIAEVYSRLPRSRGEAMSLDTGGIDPRADFLGEERDLQDLFGSILENSLKYGRSRIEVSATIDPDGERDWLVLSIGDDGDGIPAGYEREILRRGARADTAAVGQGLGLSIVVEIVSAYGGSIHCDSSKLGGALFTVRLPGARRAAAG